MSVAVANRFQSAKLKFLGRLSSGATPSSSEATFWDGDIVWITPDDLGKLEGRYISDSKRKITDEGYASCGTRLVSPGSIVISTRAPIGHLAILKSDACFNQGCKALSPNERLVPEFGYYCLLSAKSELQNLGLGTTFIELSRNSLANFRIRAPSINQQTAIVSYVDTRCAEIDDLIAKKRRLLELLAEKRAAIITRAVTKGLNPDAPMKPSGIDWLGDIPAHWEVVAFKWRCQIPSGQVDPTEDELSQLPLIAPDFIESGTGALTDPPSAQEQGAISGKYYFRSGTVVYSKIRPLLAKVCIAPFDALCSADMYPIKPAAGLDGNFLFYQLLSGHFTSFAVMESLRVAMPKVNRETLGAFPLMLPPRHEQEAITRQIREDLDDIDKSRELIERAVERLTEYRSAVITKAVLGELQSDQAFKEAKSVEV